MSAAEYPLRWPQGWKRAINPQSARFDTKFSDARNGLIEEIKRLGGKGIVLSTNIPYRKDGLPYANYKTPEDKGVAVYFNLNGKSQVFACDKWRRIEDNMQAIRKTIEAIRGIERWGSSEMMNRAYAGFVALPEATETPITPMWWEVLKVDRYASIVEIETAYRTAAKRTHPDAGGNHDEFIRVVKARDEAIMDRKNNYAL